MQRTSSNDLRRKFDTRVQGLPLLEDRYRQAKNCINDDINNIMVENVDGCETQVRYRRMMQKVARNVITEGSVDSEKASLSQH